jgi:hypothetical protein
MTKQADPFDNPQDLAGGRRRFLIGTGTGIAGLILYPLSSVVASPVFAAVAKLAGAVGAPVVESKIADFIKENANNVLKPTAVEVKAINQEIAKVAAGGFSDFSKSTVYKLQDQTSYFFYPAKTGDGSNTALVCFDTTRAAGSQMVAIISGPTLFGVSELAAAEAARRRPRDEIRRILLPNRKASRAPNPLNTSYLVPDVYSTIDMQVQVLYKIENGKRLVTVKVLDSLEELLLEGAYEIPQA